MRDRAILLASVGLAASCAWANAAWAGDKPLFQPVPAWVKPAPPIDTAKVSEDAPPLMVLDSQQRLSDGQVWSYVDTASRASNPQVLAQIATVQLPWQPAMGDLILHKAEIIRGTEHIDLLKGGAPNLTVLRREQQLEQRQFDGMLTATLPIEGLRVGDVLHIAYSMTRKDPTLKGNMQAISPLLFNPFKVQFARLRLIWPSNVAVQWKAYAKGAAPVESDADGFHEVSYMLPLPKQPEVPNDAPARFRKIPIAEASTFGGWDKVAAVMAPLFATDGLIKPGGALAQEVARIRAASADPMVRTAMALQLVQDKVRYLLMGMDTGNYVPQKPEDTWSLRYGDCKAKTLLLLAILHDLGIEAEPVLANSKYGDMLPDRVPSAGAFDHVFVRATVNGKTLWLDGTSAGARLADLGDTPPLFNVLPLRPTGATLLHIQPQVDARPQMVITVEEDQRAGLDMVTPFHASFAIRGALGQVVRGGIGQATQEQLHQAGEKMVSSVMSNTIVDDVKLRYDEPSGIATVDITGVTSNGWAREAGAPQKLNLDGVLGKTDFTPDRARPDWRDMPVAQAQGNIQVTYRIRLPVGGAGFVMEESQPLHKKLGGDQVDRTVSQSGDLVTVETIVRNSGEEIAVAAIPDARRQSSMAKDHPARMIAPAAYPQPWDQALAARKGKLLDPVLAVYAHRIAAKPDEEDGYSNRATYYLAIYDRPSALVDLNKLIAMNPSAGNYVWRSSLYEEMGDRAKALADAKAAYAADPSSKDAITRLAHIQGLMGDYPGAIALLDDRLGNGGGEADQDLISAKADAQGEGGDKDAAVATMDAAITRKPGNPDLLNERCWLKGTLNFALDTALKDCTKAIELSDSPQAAMDSRAMVYFRMNRMDDALADLNAVLDQSPTMAASHFLRGVILKRTGHEAEANADLIAARIISPQVDTRYKKWGIVP